MMMCAHRDRIVRISSHYFTTVQQLFIFTHFKENSVQPKHALTRTQRHVRCVSSGPININRHLHTWPHIIEFQTRHAVLNALHGFEYTCVVAATTSGDDDNDDATRIRIQFFWCKAFGNHTMIFTRPFNFCLISIFCL